MVTSAEIAHIKELLPYLSYPIQTHSSTSAHKKSPKLILIQLQNKILKLLQIHMSNKIWKLIYYVVARITVICSFADQNSSYRQYLEQLA